jgi:Na+/proline symporter
MSSTTKQYSEAESVLGFGIAWLPLALLALLARRSTRKGVVSGLIGSLVGGVGFYIDAKPGKVVPGTVVGSAIGATISQVPAVARWLWRH